MRRLVILGAMGALALGGGAAEAATTLSVATTGQGMITVFAGQPQESHFNFFSCPGGFFLCETTIELEPEVAATLRPQGVTLSSIGNTVGLFSGPSTTIGVDTIYTIAGHSATVTQQFTFGQIANSQFQLSLTASDPVMLDLGSLGVLEITAGGINSNLRTENDGGTFTPRTTFLLHAPVAPAVPEPATWATMIGGLGIAGAALRGRRARVMRTA